MTDTCDNATVQQRAIATKKYKIVLAIRHLLGHLCVRYRMSVCPCAVRELRRSSVLKRGCDLRSVLRDAGNKIRSKHAIQQRNCWSGSTVPARYTSRDHAQIKLLVGTYGLYGYLANDTRPAVADATARAHGGCRLRSCNCCCDAELGCGPAKCLSPNARGSCEYQSDSNEKQDRIASRPHCSEVCLIPAHVR